MPTLYFKIGADFDEVVELREEISRLKQELLSMDKNTSPEIIAELEEKLASSSSKMNSMVTEAAKAWTEVENKTRQSVGMFDLSSPVGQLKSFDNELLKMCNNLNNYFDGLLQKADSMSLLLQAGKTGIDSASANSSAQGVDDLQAKNAALTDQLIKQKEEIKLQQQEWNTLSAIVGTNSTELSGQVEKQAELNGVTVLGNQEHLNARTLIMEAREQLIQMSAGGLQNTGQYQQVSQELENMRGQMVLVNVQMVSMTKHDKNFAAIKSGLSGLASSADLVAGVMGLVNQKSKEMAELQEKIGSLLNIVTNLENIYGTVKKSNALMLAVENVQRQALAASTTLETRAKTSNIALTWAEVAAQKAFNLVANSNPYVLLATALLTVVGGIYLLISANEKSTAEQIKANMAAKESKDIQEAQTKAFSSAAASQVTSYQKLKNEYNSLGDNLKAKKKFISDNKDEFENLGFAVNGVSGAENLFKNNTSAVVNAMMLRAKATAAINMAQSSYQKMLERQSQLELKQRESKTLEEMAREAAARQDRNYDTEDPGVKLQWRQAVQKDYNAQQAEIQMYEKGVENLKSAGDSYIETAGIYSKKAESVLKGAGVKETSKRKGERKDTNQNDSLAERQQKYESLVEKHKNEQARLEIEAQNEVTQAVIAAMNDGLAKTLAQRRFNYIKETEAIKRGAEEKKQKLIDDAEAEFKANPANKEKTFDVEKFKENKSVQGSFQKIDEDTDVLLKSKKTEYNRSNLEDLGKYQDYTDKRIAIEEKFNREIAALKEQRKQAEEDGDQGLTEQLDKAVAQTTKEKGKSLIGFDFEQLKKSPEYTQAFENLKNTSSETMTSLLDQLENAKDKAAKVLSPEELREYTTAIQSIMDELDSRNPFQALIDKKNELAEAEEALANAKLELEKAKSQSEAVKGGAKIENGVVSAKYNPETKKIESVKAYLTEEQALNRVTAATSKYNGAKDNVIKKGAAVQKAEKKIIDVFDQLSGQITKLGSTIGGVAGQIIGLIGEIALFTTSVISGFDNVSKDAAKSIQAVEKASVIIGIISAAIQILNKISELIGDSYSQYEKYAEKVSELNKLTDATNRYKIAALEASQAEENWFSDNNLEKLRDIREVHDQAVEAYDQKLNEQQATYQNKEGGGWLTSLWKPVTTLIDKTYGKIAGFSINPEYEKGTTKAADNLRIETRKATKGFLGTGLGAKSQKTENLVDWAKNNGFGDLFDEKGLINEEAAKVILETYGDKLVGETKETLETLVELKEKSDEYMDQLHDYVSSLYQPLVDNFVDAIFDWLDTGKDALDSFKEYAKGTFRDIVKDLVQTLVLKEIFGEGEDSFQNKINKLYEQYSKGEISEEELYKKIGEETAKLEKRAEQSLPAIQNGAEIVTNGIKDATGIDIRNNAASESASSSGFQSMSQDTGDELNGRFTALQMAGEEIKGQNILQAEYLNLLTIQADEMLLINTGISNIADEVRGQIARSHIELTEIKENTGAIIKPIKDMAADIAEIKNNTK